MSNSLSLLISILVILISIFFLKDWPSIQAPIRDGGIGIAISSLIGILIDAWRLKDYILICVQVYFIRPLRPVRLSIAYFFRIEIDGKYLLIRNHKKPERGYQPVGGVYKYLKDENAEFFHNIGIEDHTAMGIDDVSRNDLRCIIKHRMNLPKFIDWFSSKKNRELDPWREFYEELIADNLLNREVFPYIQYTYCRSDYEGINAPDFFSYEEFLYADIYQLKPDGERQKREIRKLFDEQHQNESYIFATPEEIRKGRTDNGKIILPQARKII
ncbi:SMODS-associated NUDIX domain-containing protein [Arsenicibacter rosenii]|uniref:CD-NTase-associated protein 16 NUDIX domain-containing protein n=1 Tax=Arsenicibacter rosenii TaxID=1750698 RepID=A0A1S2VFX7_9BACT|nr:hypothetical protein [Arsenicibacter rosenii]OIN57614.1 hypothetical protein BLX24_19240 [Arsenicibacter rosenii]